MALIFLNYIKWFNGLIGGRKVLLLINSASGYAAAINTVKLTSLLNTRVKFLPKNVISFYQPLD